MEDRARDIKPLKLKEKQKFLEREITSKPPNDSVGCSAVKHTAATCLVNGFDGWRVRKHSLTVTS